MKSTERRVNEKSAVLDEVPFLAYRKHKNELRNITHIYHVLFFSTAVTTRKFTRTVQNKTLWMMGYEQKTVDLSNIILKIILLEKIYPSNN